MVRARGLEPPWGYETVAVLVLTWPFANQRRKRKVLGNPVRTVVLLHQLLHLALCRMRCFLPCYYSPKYSTPCCGETPRSPGIPLNFCRCALQWRQVLRHIRAASRKELPMDTQTVIALCDLMLVVIGIIGLALVRKE